MLKVMVAGGMDLFRAIRMPPPAWQNVDDMDAGCAFYEYNSMHMEPWDGPAGCSNRWSLCCCLPINGLSSAVGQDEEWLSNTASEIGTWDYKQEDVVAKGRVGPGEILRSIQKQAKCWPLMILIIS